jgi:hypothetical protein
MDSSEYFSCLMMTGTTVEKKLIGTDWAIYRLNNTGNFCQLLYFILQDAD